MATEGPEKRKRGRPVTKGGKDPMRSLRVPDTEWERWREVASRRGVSLSELIRQRMAFVK